MILNQLFNQLDLQLANHNTNGLRFIHFTIIFQIWYSLDEIINTGIIIGNFGGGVVSENSLLIVLLILELFDLYIKFNNPTQP